MLNENIKIDLHIHSIASKYKESVGVVDQSTVENLPVLFKKLETEGINLISFTDHNTFDSKLYIEAEGLIRLGSYPSVKGIIAGIEFDVLLDTEKPCHILAYFDCKAKEDYETDYFRFSAAPISYRATRDFNTGRIASDPTISS